MNGDSINMGVWGADLIKYEWLSFVTKTPFSSTRVVWGNFFKKSNPLTANDMSEVLFTLINIIT